MTYNQYKHTSYISIAHDIGASVQGSRNPGLSIKFCLLSSS